MATAKDTDLFLVQRGSESFSYQYQQLEADVKEGLLGADPDDGATGLVVTSFKGRKGAVAPAKSDYSLGLLDDVADDVGAQDQYFLRYVGGKWKADKGNTSALTYKGTVNLTDDLANQSNVEKVVGYFYANRTAGTVHASWTGNTVFEIAPGTEVLGGELVAWSNNGWEFIGSATEQPGVREVKGSKFIQVDGTEVATVSLITDETDKLYAPLDHVASTDGHPLATDKADGFMSASDKAFLDSLNSGGGSDVAIELGQLADVELDAPEAGNVLAYKADGNWVNAPASIDPLVRNGRASSISYVARDEQGAAGFNSVTSVNVESANIKVTAHFDFSALPLLQP